MADNILNARMRQKNDTKANWEANSAFVPLQGEIIIYNDTKQMKIGDGVTPIGQLNYTFETASVAEIKNYLGID